MDIRHPIVGPACVALALAAAAMPAAAGDPLAGKNKSRACAVCHGLYGKSERPDAPHLSGQVEPYLVQQLRAYRDGKRRHEVMSIVAADLTNADIDDLSAWYASIEITVKQAE
jgi:cytochrome c553